MFVTTVKEQLHVVLAMSPIGNEFRNRLRMFPALVNCCTINWFQVGNTMYLADSTHPPGYVHMSEIISNLTQCFDHNSLKYDLQAIDMNDQIYENPFMLLDYWF
jgi:hypothetical protein